MRMLLLYIKPRYGFIYYPWVQSSCQCLTLCSRCVALILTEMWFKTVALEGNTNIPSCTIKRLQMIQNKQNISFLIRLKGHNTVHNAALDSVAAHVSFKALALAYGVVNLTALSYHNLGLQSFLHSALYQRMASPHRKG